jgi:hypothetical protein
MHSSSSSMKLGGANKKMKKYPRIIDYLEVHHPEVYDLIEDLAMHGNLTPKRGGAVTFLIPDSAYIKEIKKTIESDEPEKATDMLSSLIIPDLFEKPEDFSAKKDDVPNLLEKKITIKNVASGKVLIDDGELTLDTKFRPFARQGKSKRGNMAVWNLKGKVEYEKAPPATMKYIRGPKKGAHQSRMRGGDGDSVSSELHRLVQETIREKVHALSIDKRADDGKVYCPILNAVTWVLRGFSENHPEEYRSARCLLTMCPLIDFFILYCNPCVFSPQVILEARKVGVERDSNVDTYKRFCSDYSNPALVGDPALLLKQDGVLKLNILRDKIRDKMLSTVSSGLAKSICDLYDRVDSTNAIEGVGPVYPKALAGIFARNKKLHLLLDEVSNILYLHLQNLKSLAQPQEKAQYVQSELGEFLAAYGIDVFCSPERKTRLDKPEFFNLLDKKDIYTVVTPFWRTFGLHMPCVLEHEFDTRVVMGAGETPEFYSRDLYDVDHHIVKDLETYDNCPLCISDRSIAEMKAYMRSHGGQLPEGLSS